MPNKNNLEAPRGRVKNPPDLMTKIFTPLALIIISSSVTLNTGCGDTSDEAFRLLREAEEGAGLAGEASWFTRGEWANPLFLRHDGDRPADIIGYVQKGSASPWVSLALFDGTTFEQRWEAGPFKVALRHGQPRDPLLVVAKGHVVTSPDYRSVYIINGHDGSERDVFEFESNVRALCLSGEEHVGINLASTRHRRLDVATGRIGPIGNPDWCLLEGRVEERHSLLFRCGHDTGGALCHDVEYELHNASPLDLTNYVLEHDDLAIGVGRADSTDYADTTVVGIRRRLVNHWWRQSFDSQIQFVHFDPDAFYAVLRGTRYGTSGRLVALDPSSGVIRWAVELPWSTEAVVGPLLYEDGRLYLPRSTWLDVFDAATGTTLANIGTTP